MNHSILSATAFVVLSGAMSFAQPATAQSPVLMEIYGRGVHAYYSYDYAQAYELLTLAIDNGLQDPRAYYFRGVVAEMTGRPDEAEADWQTGADLEASGRVVAPIGRSLARIQGPIRLELEAIRQQARMRALATAAERSESRYGEIDQARTSPPPAQPAAPVTPPPAPPVAATASDNPFRDDAAAGDPTVDSNDAFAGAEDTPVPGGSPPVGDTAAPDDASPFGAAPADDSNPFGAAPADDADPFSTPPAGNDSGDPFAPDPFGN